MICSIMQPTYFPWIGYFDLIDKVDKFVFLDNVQIVKRSWDVKNRIKTDKGELYITIPINKTKSRDETYFNNAIIHEKSSWKKKQLKSIELNYKKSKFFYEMYPFIEDLINYNSIILSEFNINIIKSISHKLGIKTEFITASNLNNISGSKDKLLVSICQEIKCSEYLSPRGSAVYIEKNNPGGEFTKNGIKLYYQNYSHPIYEQLWGDFISHLSIIDLLFNSGFTNSLEIIRTGNISYAS